MPKANEFNPQWNNLLLKVVKNSISNKIDIKLPGQDPKKHREFLTLYIEKMGPGVGNMTESPNNDLKIGQEVWLKPHAQLSQYKNDSDFLMVSEHDIMGAYDQEKTTG